MVDIFVRLTKTILTLIVVLAKVSGISLVVISGQHVYGQGFRGVVEDLVRGTTRVADEIPVKKVEDLITDISKSRTTREVIETDLKKASRVVEMSEGASGVLKSESVFRLLRNTAKDIDPNVLRRIERLDGPTRESMYILSKGGVELTGTIPDLATRARLLQNGGVETVAAVGLFGPEAARAALRLDEALQAGAVVVKGGQRAVTVADFGIAMTRFGDGSWSFWKRYVAPNWKMWVTSGALAAYLANPDFFQDAAGTLTEEGFKRLTGFVGDIASAAIRGTAEGSGKATLKVRDAIWETYIKGENGIYAILGTMIFIGCLSLFFRRIRSLAFRPFQWLNKAPDPSLPQS